MILERIFKNTNKNRGIEESKFKKEENSIKECDIKSKQKQQQEEEEVDCPSKQLRLSEGGLDAYLYITRAPPYGPMFKAPGVPAKKFMVSMVSKQNYHLVLSSRGTKTTKPSLGGPS